MLKLMEGRLRGEDGRNFSLLNELCLWPGNKEERESSSGFVPLDLFLWISSSGFSRAVVSWMFLCYGSTELTVWRVLKAPSALDCIIDDSDELLMLVRSQKPGASPRFWLTRSLIRLTSGARPGPKASSDWLMPAQVLRQSGCPERPCFHADQRSDEPPLLPRRSDCRRKRAAVLLKNSSGVNAPLLFVKFSNSVGIVFFGCLSTIWFVLVFISWLFFLLLFSFHPPVVSAVSGSSSLHLGVWVDDPWGPLRTLEHYSRPYCCEAATCGCGSEQNRPLCAGATCGSSRVELSSDKLINKINELIRSKALPPS